MNKQNNDTNSNPFKDNSNPNPIGDNSNPTTERKIINKSNLDAQKPSESITDTTNLHNPFDNNTDPFSKRTVVSYNQNQPQVQSNYSSDKIPDIPYASPSNSDKKNNDNPFLNDNNSGNPFGSGDNPYGGGNDEFPKPETDSNPYGCAPQDQKPFGGDQSSEKFIKINISLVIKISLANPKVEGYNDVGLGHLTTLDSQLKSNKDKPPQ